MLKFALLSVVVVALAAPAPDPCRTNQQKYLAKYDDLPYTEGIANPIPPHYNGLSYVTFQVDQFDFFIHPTSGTKYAMAFGGSGNITVPDSKTFTLESFNFACDSGIPQPECAISMWGWRDRNVAVKRTLKYPRLDPGHETKDFVMNFTSFDWRWRDLTSIGFSIARADNGGDMFGGLMLDDVRYVVNTGCV